MASLSNQVEELAKMVVVVKSKKRARDKDVGLDKVIDNIIEMSGQFNTRNDMEFLDMYRREMQQTGDVLEGR